jgi:hypothetical protein
MKNLSQTSSKMTEILKLRIKANEFEFEAEGATAVVCEQFEAFQKFLSHLPKNQIASNLKETKDPLKSHLTPNTLTDPISMTSSSISRNTLIKLFTEDPRTTQLTPNVSLPEGNKAENTILLLLLGYRELKNHTEVSALWLNHALKGIGGAHSRLDRVLAGPLRKQHILKSGKGKGGKYRLTTLGIHQAKEMARELADLIPDSPA